MELQQYGSTAQTVAEHPRSLHEGDWCAVQQQVGSFAKAVDHNADTTAAENNPVFLVRLRIGAAAL
jgi:hypothetical protein